MLRRSFVEKIIGLARIVSSDECVDVYRVGCAPRKDVDAHTFPLGLFILFIYPVEVYPRPNGEIYICGIGGSDYISTDQLKQGAFRNECQANEQRVQAAAASFQEMSSIYKKEGELQTTQACMRPCPPDAMPYMGPVPGYEGAYLNAGHNCWYVVAGGTCCF